MVTKSVIVAMDENNAIGKDNQLLCHLPNDLKYFKTVTQGHTVIMGRKTFESLPNGALPYRRNIVISRNTSYKKERTEVFTSLNDAFATCTNENEVFIIGGGSIYEQALQSADKLYVTYIHHKFENTDTFFPSIDPSIWKQVSAKEQSADEKNKYAHTFVVYEKR
ncbi:dihydrofolate reductase [Dysgonomonas sp. 216]|uniref:dihydrofolate reductase n=1 Tax=Dysgonomonas sp. 216 TaxID=2302934 RepID=UPI0013D0ED28|nr:dihydrofolate reductase [Dysgonomonas sp. 216]NDW17308.1 dihydrofolate reductase [Dysgonomonas sp. 216]